MNVSALLMALVAVTLAAICMLLNAYHAIVFPGEWSRDLRSATIAFLAVFAADALGMLFAKIRNRFRNRTTGAQQ